MNHGISGILNDWKEKKKNNLSNCVGEWSCITYQLEKMLIIYRCKLKEKNNIDL
jgi:hypothetical protein